jgi:hypothetical protein
MNIANITRGRLSDRRPTALTKALLACLALACAAPDEPDLAPARIDSAGVSLVLNSSTDLLLDWSFERILSLGGTDDGPDAFFRVFPTSIGVDSLGNLYVLDAGQFSVSVFDRSGRHLRSFGRQGQGPGEFGFPSDMAVTSAGEVAVHDFARRALVLFDAEGSYAGTFPLPGPLQRQVVLLEDGTIVAAVTEASPTAGSIDYRVLGLGRDTVEVARVRQLSATQPQMTSCGPVGIPPYFGPRVAWAAAGNRIAFSKDATYAIHVTDGTGFERIWKRDLRPIRSTPELAAWEAAEGDSVRFPGGCALSAEEAARQFGYHENAPLIQGLAVSPDGTVWVRRRTERPGQSQIDVMDATGAYLGTVPEGSPFPALFSRVDEIITVERDELDRPRVVMYRIRRGDLKS